MLLTAASRLHSYLPAFIAVAAGIGCGALTFRILQVDPCQAVLRYVVRFGWLITAAVIAALIAYS